MLYHRIGVLFEKPPRAGRDFIFGRRISLRNDGNTENPVYKLVGSALVRTRDAHRMQLIPSRPLLSTFKHRSPVAGIVPGRGRAFYVSQSVRFIEYCKASSAAMRGDASLSRLFQMSKSWPLGRMTLEISRREAESANQ